ncbi:2-methylcitrate dehydratase [Pseudomonas sp. SDI]|uniref:bifunctional 2-methylcitrate dehydratase/aconitate hydratase n=1 Tax=Pseudomonas sp. SDI TaxID=2170734 RepID=UPI000DE5DFD8|nr:bifunctional 2-methylcitrate dehydratase/aconitate hydratase [Pseudomonas sp. SDI]PWB30085.1 2-methylcitrate dehydratase [Pseudomonas sp. SDI]
MDTREFDSLIQKIVEHIYTPRRSSDGARTMARYALLDSIGCALAALGNPSCCNLLNATTFSQNYNNGARIPGTRTVLAPVEAAFHIGTLIRWLEFNDTWLAQEWGHPSDNLGAILAVADWMSREQQRQGLAELHMGDVLEVMIRSYEVHGVLCLENCFNALGIDHVIFVKVVSAAAASYLMGLEHEQALNAVSNAFIDGHALRTYRHAPNAGTRKSWAAGDASARGVQLALFSRAGEMGYPSALSASKWGFNDALFRGQALSMSRVLGEYVINNILFKVPNPAEYHAQTAVEAAIGLHAQMRAQGIGIDAIERIQIHTQKPAMQIINKRGHLNNPADRDHCLQYMVAVALLTGDLTSADFEAPMADNAQVEELRRKMHCEECPTFTANYYAEDKRSIGNRLKIHFRGTTPALEATLEYPLGHRLRRAECFPLLLEKFRRNAAEHYQPERILALENLIGDAARLETLPVHAFMSALI